MVVFEVYGDDGPAFSRGRGLGVVRIADEERTLLWMWLFSEELSKVFLPKELWSLRQGKH